MLTKPQLLAQVHYGHYLLRRSDESWILLDADGQRVPADSGRFEDLKGLAKGLELDARYKEELEALEKETEVASE